MGPITSISTSTHPLHLVTSYVNINDIITINQKHETTLAPNFWAVFGLKPS